MCSLHRHKPLEAAAKSPPLHVDTELMFGNYKAACLHVALYSDTPPPPTCHPTTPTRVSSPPPLPQHTQHTLQKQINVRKESQVVWKGCLQFESFPQKCTLLEQNLNFLTSTCSRNSLMRERERECVRWAEGEVQEGTYSSGGGEGRLYKEPPH